MLPFADLKVLDLTHVFAGPFATYQLGVLGAEVIKIEPVDRPDMARFVGPDSMQNQELMGMHFRAQGCGKQCLALDLKTERGKEILNKLVFNSDVLVQNYTMNAAVKLGLTATSLHKVNPKLICCSMSGYGYTGPKANHPAYDIVIQAFTGAMFANVQEGQNPQRIGPAVIDYSTGTQAAFAIASALYMREKTGKGCSIDVSMADCALMLMNYNRFFALEKDEVLSSSGNNDSTLAGYGAYETCDGVIMIGAFTVNQMTSLLNVLGFPEEAAEIKGCEHHELSHRYDKHSKLLMKACLNSEARTLEKLLNEAHVPAARLRNICEALQEEQFESRAVFTELNGKRATAAGFQFGDNKQFSVFPPRKFGEDSKAILLNLGYDERQINEMQKNKIIA
ncbi:MAG: CaiB/BaiF CoA transferase family protein [Candidatus Puniceispirillaceae bacterium]